jgi:hypothetical protein
MPGINQNGYSYRNISASANVSNVSCTLAGVFCSTSTSGTIAIYDSATTTTSLPVTGTIALTAGQFYSVPAGLGYGCYVVIGGTANVTVFTA